MSLVNSLTLYYRLVNICRKIFGGQ